MGKLIFVGNFQLGLHNIRLYANPTGRSGNVDLRPDDVGVAQIVVGIEDENWPDVQATLLHEAYEEVFIEMGVRFAPRPSFSDIASNYVFHMTHDQLDEAHVRVSWFLSKSLSKFKHVYDKFWKKRYAEQRKKKK